MDEAVSAGEKLARYILHSAYLRQDQTVRSNGFIPHPYKDLSVTRHLGLSEDRIWAIGSDVAGKTGKKLYARADVPAGAVLDQQLQIHPAPFEGNPNHANIAGWPADKPSQMSIAQKIAASAGKAIMAPSAL